jgi:outer membrane protein TolC
LKNDFSFVLDGKKVSFPMSKLLIFIKLQLFFSMLTVMISTNSIAQPTSKGDTLFLSLEEVVYQLSWNSPAAIIKKLNFRNELLQHENYKKSLLPSFSLDVNPINFNRSLRQLQNPSDGSYSYVEDYSNSSNAGVSIRQRVGLTGGELSMGSNLRYLNEFSFNRSSFSTTPFTIGYSQQLLGGRTTHRFEKTIAYKKNEVAIKQYCTEMLGVQQQALGLFTAALLSKLQQELSLSNKLATDTLLQIATLKLLQGNITEYDYKQVKLQQANNLYQYESAVKNYRESLHHLMLFLSIAHGAVIVETPLFDMPEVLDVVEVVSRFYKNNPFELEQEVRKLEAEQSLYLAKLSSGVNSSISMSYGSNQHATALLDAYRHANTQQAVTVSLQIPIFQWGANSNKLKIAQNSYKAAVLSMETGRQERDSEVKEQVATYNQNVRLWHISEQAFHLSQENYEMSVQKYALGKISMYELTAAQQEQATNMQRYYSAIRDVWAGYFALRMLTLYDFKKQQELTDMLTAVNHND